MLAAVARGGGEAEQLEQRVQLLHAFWGWRGEFDEFEAIGHQWIGGNGS